MIISVTQLNNFMKGVVDSEPILSNIFVKGEISNYKESYDSLYFCLKDEFSQIDCFAYMSQTGKSFANGMTVVADGSVNFLTKFGKLSFTAKKITPENNLGLQYKKLLELKAKLEKEGCFSTERKKAVPTDCKTIGVVSSESGAVIHDIFTVALRRNPSVNILLYPVKVQGVGAEAEIKKGIEYFSAKNNVDAVIIARGGGSNEDLSVFNTEMVVRAINNSKIPTVSAVGHDTDFTFADFAADKRAATPTEAAEFLTADIANLKKLALSTLNRIYSLVKDKVEHRSQKTAFGVSSMFIAADKTLHNVEKEIISLSKSLDAVNPLKILSKGYTQITKDGKTMKNISELSINDDIKFTLIDGTAEAKITKLKVKK
ncbi:MAG TPA: exodeoxyribonuclease VII large subunit [Clostridia bacterium]|nr:exodeoxyribonuclease VII large subunit [Clostridia bacterium]